MPRNPLKNIASWVFKYKGTQAEAQALLDAHLVTKKNYFPKQVLRQTHMWAQLSHEQSHFNSAQREFRAPQPPEGGNLFNYYYFSLTPKHKQPLTTIHTLWGGVQLGDGEEIVAAEDYCINLLPQNQPQNEKDDDEEVNEEIEIEIPQGGEDEPEENEEDPIDDEKLTEDTLIKRLKVSQLTRLFTNSVRPLIEDIKTHVNTKMTELNTKLTNVETNVNIRLQNLEETMKKLKEDKEMAPPLINLNRRNR
jgi:hypothetical protein